MLTIAVVILIAGVFANQHAPCWYDEICMIDPAFQRVKIGVWRSIAQWDSIDVVPFAPNYPLHINILRILIMCFGVNFWILRGAMLFFGLVPVGILLWIFRRKGYFSSGTDVLCACYFTACFSFFYWSIYIRPEAILLSVATLLVFAWANDRPCLLFFASLLVPVCGLQWNVLLLPVAFHWLIFGGRFRNPVLVAVAFALSSVTTLAAYHLLGMWPSYLQEVARVGGLDAFANAKSKLFQLVCHGNGRFLAWGIKPYDSLPVLLLFVLGAVSFPFFPHVRKTYLFMVLSWTGVVLALAFFGSLNSQYAKLLVVPVVFLLCVVLSPVWKKQCLFLLLCMGGAFLLAGFHWNKLCRMPNFTTAMTSDVSSVAFWNDEYMLRQAVRSELTPDDIVACESPAYFEIRARCADLVPLCYAFDIGKEQRESITALLLADEPYRIVSRDNSMDRRTSFAKALSHYSEHSTLLGGMECISPDDLLSAISDCWQCSFIEIPLASPTIPHAIRYRLFRPVFHKECQRPLGEKGTDPNAG